MSVCENCLRARGKKPCDGWINCRSYTDQEKQLKRLMAKEEPTEIHDWYRHSYRENVFLGDFISSS